MNEPFCINCGGYHQKDKDCPYVWQICKVCGNKFKTAPDVPVVCGNVGTCGQCGAENQWEFKEADAT
jgi:uncharacterized Fe-S cluster-containing MiaB family protein